VFGLDDYARDGAGGAPATTSGSSTGQGAASGGGSSGGRGDTGGANSTSDVGISAASAGGSPASGCQCLPPIPTGWELFDARAVGIAAPPADCVGDRRVVAGALDATCTCSCDPIEVACTAATLRCWDGDGCAGAEASWTAGDGCTAIGSRRSCTVEEGSPTGPTCAAQGVAGAARGDAFDLCAATRQEAPECASSGRCVEASAEGRVCIEGEGTCPDGWDLEQHDVAGMGAFGCACTCADRGCTGAEFRLSGDYGFGSNAACLATWGADASGNGCHDVTNPGENAAGHARRREASVVEGACAPLDAVVDATYTPGEDARLCCLPPP